MLYLRSEKIQVIDRDSTKFQIMASAIALFASKGYAGTSMREIASSVNIKAASLYSHWPRGKEQLLEDSLHEIFNKFLAFVTANITGNSSSLEQLETVVRSHLSWQITFGEQAMAWDMLVQQYGVTNVLSRNALELIRSNQQMYHGYLEVLVRETARQPSRASDISIAIRTMCDQVASWFIKGEDSLVEQSQAIDRVWWLCRQLIKAHDV